MFDEMALGNYGEFQRWTGKPRAWGPEGEGWRAWFGGRVVDGLCEVIDEHLATKRRGVPAAIGCVPWLTSPEVTQRLLNLSAFCVVVDKGKWFPERLCDPEKGLPNYALVRLRDLAPMDDGGAAPLLGPYSQMPEHEVGPVRVAGWRRGGKKPLLHAKVLVLGHLVHNAYGSDDSCGEDVLDFEPRTVWWGSANWTALARKHLELGFSCNDPDLVLEATEFVTDVIAFSEPVDTACVGPDPNLIGVEYDEGAMREALEDRQPPDDED